MPEATPDDAPGFLERLGVRSDGPGRLVLEVGPGHLRSLGIAHGGVIASMLDSVMGLAASRSGPADHYLVTAQLTVHFVRPARAGETVVASSLVRHAGRKTAVTQGEVSTASGELVATASATFLYLPHSEATRSRPDRLDPGPS